MNPMIENLNTIPKIIQEKVPEIDRKIRHTFSHHDLLNTKEIVLTGCGDSFFAPIAAKYAFQRFAGITTHAFPAMEAGRYYLVDNQSSFVKNPMVLAISVSGDVSRTVEALQIAKEKNCYTVAITGNPESRLAKSAEKIIDASLPPMEHHSPGIASYRMSLLILYLFSIHLAEVRGKILMSEADKLRKELLDTSAMIENTINACKPIAKQMADDFYEQTSFVFVSDGPGRATAEFSAAKIIEATGRIGLAQDTEEWAHLQVFNTAELPIPTFLISSGKRGISRVVENVSVMRRIGRKIILVANDEEKRQVPEVDYYFPLEGEVRDEFRPLVNSVGCELFAAFLSEKLNSQYFRRGQEGYELGNGIRESQIIVSY